MAQIKALVLDWGNVLLSWTPPTESRIPKTILKHIMVSDIWKDYERGRFNAEECYQKIAKQFGFKSEDMRAFMKDAGDNLRINEETMMLIKDLRESRRGLKLYGITNNPKPEQYHMNSTLELWPIFDHIFISSSVGMKKPDICFYNHVLEQINLTGDSAIFVDDFQENILSAISLGVRDIRFTSLEDLRSRLFNILDDPVTRGYRILDSNAKQLKSITNQGHVIKENFAQLLILEMTKRRDLVDLEHGSGTWNYFIEGPQLTTRNFPNDLDTTSLALSIIPQDGEIVKSVMDEMLTYVSEDGIIMTYFGRTRSRVDPVVCVNVLNLFLIHGRQDELKPTWDWVLRVLENRAYLDGTRYYSAEAFLSFLSRLTKNLRIPCLQSKLLPLLKIRITERIGEAGDPSDLAMRASACKILNILNSRDMDRLWSLQCSDGGWPAGAVYRYGRSGLEIGNRGLVSTIALNALEMPDLAQDDLIQVRSFSLGNPLFMVKHLLEGLVHKKS